MILNLPEQRSFDNIGEDAFDENGKLKEMYANSKAGKEFLAAQQKLAEAGSALTGEDSVYYHLYRFFSRYYDNGDFVSMRYHTRETEGMARPYAIPYGGEEVMLHWANSDQYYIKTSENFNNFSFDLTKATVFDKMGREEKILAGIPDTPLMVHFKVVDADEGEHGNIKADPNKKREFFLAAENPVQLDSNGELEIHFEFRQVEDSDKITPEDEALVKEAYGAKNKGDFPLLAITAKIIAACHDLNQKLLNEKSPCSLDYYMTVMQYPCPTDAVKNRILLSKYLYQYTARNTSDYFIHKNLRGFLRREMDFYIKNEIMNLDDIENSDAAAVENYLVLLKVFRRIAGKLIDFLGQLEEFQKKLWLKKKFVVQCDCCITLDRVPKTFYPEILRNRRQWEEWKALGLFDPIDLDDISPADTVACTVKFTFNDFDYLLLVTGKELKITKLPSKDFSGAKDDGYVHLKMPMDVDIRKDFPHLMVDTKFFSEDFKARLFASIPDFDEQCDGVLIHSENFQALNLLRERYKEQIKTLFSDPPYNTGENDFSYKDGYMHSSWMTMMHDRLKLQQILMNENSCIFHTIDEKEYLRLNSLCNLIFNEKNRIEEIIWRKKSGGGQQDDFIVKEHDYIPMYAKDKSRFALLEKKASKKDTGYTLFDDEKKQYFKKTKLAKWGSAALREDRPTMYFPIVAPDGSECFPVAPDGRPGRWRKGKTKVDILLAEHDIHWEKNSNDEWIPYEKEYKPMGGEENTLKERSIFWDIAENADGANELTAMWGVKDIFKNPKPSDLIFNLLLITTQFKEYVLDIFAGAGTTGHAVINLNREDGGKRKYILVEMGDHFDTVLKPRLEKVVFAKDWKDGKPQTAGPRTPQKDSKKILGLDVGADQLGFALMEDGEFTDCGVVNLSNPFNGISHCFKYIRLESYEDTLNNLVMPEEDSNLAKMNGSLKEDYMLHYMLDAEAQDSLLNIRNFANPWDYQLKVKQPNSEASVVSTVDLVETFNYLIGLRIQQYYRIQNYSASFKRSVDPELPRGGKQTRLELKTKPELDSNGAWRFQKIEGWIPANPQTPNDGRKKNVLIIWRTLTGNLEQDNLMLDWYMSGTLNLDEKTPEYDIIYVNGSNNLGADRKETDTFQVRLIEEEFLKKMWTAGEC